MTSPVDWTVLGAEVGETGSKGTRNATDTECRALAAELQVVALEYLTVNYEIRPVRREAFRLTGELRARVAQRCIVTLEPVTGDVKESFRVELRPAADLEPPPEREEQEILDAEDIEALEGDRIELGRIVFEYLSAAIDPYPRSKGAEFKWEDPKAGEERGPFAVLENLKRPRES
jgi:Large ribosomal RNA subunit accumulation protein YceD